MGNRANIVVKTDKTDNGIYFYSHWDGDEIGETLKAALSRGKNRWDDEPYLNRIIFSEMINGHILEETGYGITNYVTDGDSNIWEVNHADQTVSHDGICWSFDEFTA